jgi:hypothetical protein
VNLLVVMPIRGSRRQQRMAIRTALGGLGLAKDIILVIPEEVERYRDMVGTLIRPALREGKLLYDRPRR